MSYLKHQISVDDGNGQYILQVEIGHISTANGMTGDKVVLPGRVIEYEPKTDEFNSNRQMPQRIEHMAVSEVGLPPKR